MTDSEDDSECPPMDLLDSFQTINTQLEKVYEQLTEAVAASKTIAAKAKKIEQRVQYTKQYPLTHDAQSILKREKASLKEVLQIWMPLWKEEGRVYEKGRMIRVGIEGRLFGLKPELKVDIYELCKKMMCLFRLG